jgi:uncharacterized repeat protein (TIGR03803 family)
MQTQSICAGLLCLLTMASSRAQDHWVMHHFNGLDGDNPTSLLLSGTTFFGATYSGGNSNRGTVFRLDTDGSNFMVLKDFTGDDGASPWGNLVLSGGTLYGTTTSGGNSNCGTVFKLRTDGSDFTVLKQFGGSDGMEPRGLTIIDTTLYGTTFHGGISNRGTIFKLNTDGSDFTLLKEFTDDPEMVGMGSLDGCWPSGCLARSGTNLYGTTMYGGSLGRGVVFKINTDGTGYTVLHHGKSTDGGHYFLGVTVVDATLYGATSMGSGGSSLADIFRLNTDGSGFTLLAPLTGFNGTSASSLVLSGSHLYGSAFQGGLSNAGTVFMLNPDGSQLIPIKHFRNFDGFSPRSLVLSDAVLYGVTGSGGSSDHGTMFGLSLPPPVIFKLPASQTAEAGDNVRISAHAEGAQPLAYKWVFDDTNVLSDGTNKLLRLTNVHPAQAGGYTVVVSNLFGMATSPPAALNVIAPVTKIRVPGILLQGEAGNVLQVDYVNDFSLATDWLPLETVSLTSTSQFSFDVTMPLPVQRFYRAWQTGTSDIIPALNLYLIPAITLTGTPSDQVRVDGINAIGPTDAWFTLDTVTLTNTSQFYFDVSSIGQPRRLYRLTPRPQE